MYYLTIMIIRPATPADNPALLALARETPMEGNLVIQVDRTPDYFQLARLQGRDQQILIAEDHGKITGMVGYALRNVRLNNRSQTIAYIGGVKVTRATKTGFTVFRLMNAVRTELVQAGISIGILLVLADNQRMLPLLTGRAGLPVFHSVARFQICYYVPLWNFRKQQIYTIYQATDKDYAELARLFESCMTKRALAPPEPNDYLADCLRQNPDFKLSNFWLARKPNGRLAAALSVWDQSAFKRTVILRYGGWLTLLKTLQRPLGFLPAPGQTLKELSFRHLLYRESELPSLRCLVRQVVRRYRSDYRLFRFGFHRFEPLREVLPPGLKINIPLDLFIGFKAESSETQAILDLLQHNLIWEDLTLH
jgi:hypothetical protein